MLVNVNFHFTLLQNEASFCIKPCFVLVLPCFRFEQNEASFRRERSFNFLLISFCFPISDFLYS